MSDGSKSKRAKVAETKLDMVPVTNQSLAVSESATNKNKLQGSTVALTGHTKPIFSISFSPNGENLASASLDETILLWDSFGENKNYNVLTGHKNAVLNVKWLTNQSLVSVSADKLVSLWDGNKGVRIRKYTEHDGIVNTCSVCTGDSNLFVTGSDDGKLLVWDVREKASVSSIECEYPVLSSCLNESGSAVYIGGIDNSIT